MNFKTWLNANETVMGSDGRDSQPAQTNQAANQAAQDILSSPAFAPVQSKLISAGGSPSAQQNQLFNTVAKGFSQVVPNQTSKIAPVSRVAFNIQKALKLKTNVQKPSFMKGNK